MTGAMSCIHANECPMTCPCAVDCYCREHTCKPRERGTNRERVTGSSASIQTVGTPRWLIDSVIKTWGQITLDAAADAINKVCDNFIGESTDATALPCWIAPRPPFTPAWPGALISGDVKPGIVWCNPPYKTAGKFAAVALASAKRGQTVVMLVLASVGSKWWANYVHRKADVYFIRPRIKFVGHKQSFMKDLAILVYRPGFVDDDNGQYYCAKLEADTVQNIRTCAA